MALSDTHGRHSRFRDLPEADVFLHAGDFTNHGSGAEEFAMWFHRLPYRLKLLTLGNHELRDAAFARRMEQWQSLFGPMLLLDRGVRAVVEGVPLVVLGLPHESRIQEIPEGVDIVLSHEPPYRILDRTHGGAHAGSERVAGLVSACTARVHVFGHVHAQGGKIVEETVRTYVNAATRPVLFHLA